MIVTVDLRTKGLFIFLIILNKSVMKAKTHNTAVGQREIRVLYVQNACLVTQRGLLGDAQSSEHLKL